MMISAKFERKLFSKLDGKLDKMLSSIASQPNEKASLKDRVAELKQGLERQKRRRRRSPNTAGETVYVYLV